MRISAISVAVLLIVLPITVGAADWTTTAGSTVEFTARITGGSFLAKSQKVSATATSDDGQTLTRVSVLVDAGSFETGIDLRDEHLRDKYLEASTFREIRFVADGQSLAVKPGSPFSLRGTLTVKGVSKPVQVEGRFESASVSEVVASTRFKVDVTEFGIRRPSFAVVKMDPVVDVAVRLVLRRMR
jgi:polyisoprenoid-binding protein YceI